MPARLDPARTTLLLVDWQERLFPAMPEAVRDQARAHAANLRWLAGELGLGALATEQYPRGLGHTLPDLALPDPIEKLSFSAMGAAGFPERLGAALPGTEGPGAVLVSGMETHICVAQTCRDLIAAGYEVWLVADACLSRRKLDWRLGVERVRTDGARVVTAEGALFELVGAAGTPIFKELSRRIR